MLTDADQPVHLLGHSYGAAVALQLALRWPERVASMTLYEPVRFALLSDVDGASAAEAAQASEARYQITTAANRFSLAVMSGRREEAAERFVDFWGGPGSWAAMDQRHRQLQMAATPKVHAEYQALMADGVRGSAYESLTMPVHLIGGTSSPLAVREVMRRLAARVPHAATVSIIGLGHMGPVVAAGRVRAHLPEWLQAPAAIRRIAGRLSRLRTAVRSSPSEPHGRRGAGRRRLSFVHDAAAGGRRIAPWPWPPRSRGRAARCWSPGIR